MKDAPLPVRRPAWSSGNCQEHTTSSTGCWEITMNTSGSFTPSSLTERCDVCGILASPLPCTRGPPTMLYRPSMYERKTGNLQLRFRTRTARCGKAQRRRPSSSEYVLSNHWLEEQFSILYCGKIVELHCVFAPLPPRTRRTTRINAMVLVVCLLICFAYHFFPPPL